MAFITVGINTDRVYNKKNPPGGACSDLFGGPAEEICPNPKKLNRLRSSMDLGGEAPEPARHHKKSQPSVCPLTGETLGSSVAKLEISETKAEASPEAAPATEKAEPAKPAETKQEGEVKVAEPPTTKGDIVRESPPAPAAAPEAGEPAPASAPASAPAPAPEMTQAESAPAPALESALAPEAAPKSALAPAPASPVPASPAPESAPAPAQQRRRNPPGGHSTGFW